MPVLPGSATGRVVPRFEPSFQAGRRAGRFGSGDVHPGAVPARIRPSGVEQGLANPENPGPSTRPRPRPSARVNSR